MTRAIHLNKDSSPPPYCYVAFEDYLKPKSVVNKNPLLCAKPPLRLKLLEHPVLIAGRKSKCLLFKEKLQKVFKTKIAKRSEKTSKIFTIANAVQLPRFLHFLHARNDDTACKRKSGFEIYCEIASIHGFTNFVGATTWQRAFWFLVVLIAVIMSGSFLLLSHFMNASVPTILYPETTQYPTQYIPFPAVTICNTNKISKNKAESLAQKFQATTNMTVEELTNSFNLALSTTENIVASSDDYQNLNEILKMNNYTMFRLLNDISPNCNEELLRCMFQGKLIRCGYLFKKIETPFGQCCSFNYKAGKTIPNILADYTASERVEFNSSCGSINGLTVLLDPQLHDYKASSFLTPGYQVLIHDAHDYPDIGSTERLITPAKVNKIRVLARQTYATDHISSLNIHTRKCYLPNEPKLYHFDSYSQTNCLAECRSSLIFEKCKCALPYRPKKDNWTVCGLEDIQCYKKYKDLDLSNLKEANWSQSNEQFMCGCYPMCDFYQYSAVKDSSKLTRKYSMTEKLYRGINVTNHILLQVYINELHSERLRLDVHENWLSFIGTFGGITGLHMGYSFLSGFELIFFVFVRPACNWCSKKLIQYKKQRMKARLVQQA